MLPIRDDEPSRRYPVVMVLLIMANVIAFFYEISLGREGLQALFLRYGVVPAYFTGADMPPEVAEATAGYATLFTSMFLHGGWLHLISNMWYLWIFGDNVEDQMGPGRFLLFYVLGGLAASAAHILLSPGSWVPSVGASGAIAAVLGAYLLMFPHARIIALVPVFFFAEFVELPALLVLGFWFVTQLFSGVGSLAASSAQTGGVAYWAHVGGFVFGMIALRLFRERRRSRWVHDGELPWPF